MHRGALAYARADLYPVCVSWLLIKFSTSPQHVTPLTDVLEACGALSVTIESDDDDEQRLQSGLENTPLWSANRTVGLFPDHTDPNMVRTAVREAMGDSAIFHEAVPLPDNDWERAWMTNYRPVQVAPHLWICPSWCTPPDPNAVNLSLDPGLAFGTGTHPTTALCLAWLAEQPLTGTTIIDYGCGSGILAIAALKLGAQTAIGIDIDPQALAVSRENALRNGVDDRYSTCTPAELEVDAGADIVVANILAGTLIELAPEITRHVKPRGHLALSGVLSEQITEVQRGYASRFALEARERDGWALLIARRAS